MTENTHEETVLRLSLGSAVKLGLREARMDADPTTLYSMVGEVCVGNCRFCTQASSATVERPFLSRITWPEFAIQEVLQPLDDVEGIARICFQTLNYPELVGDLTDLVSRVREHSDLPISACMNPVDKDSLYALKAQGVERVGVGLDCATPECFAAIKPGYSWTRYQQFIRDTIEVFGKGSVHLIVGLGDDDEAIVSAIQRYADMNCSIALFAYTPMRGTELELPQPPIERYRALQMARYLLTTGRCRIDSMQFEEGRLVHIGCAHAVEQALHLGTPFRTSGCPGCNRPLYNERPGGAMYNYACPLDGEQRDSARQEYLAYFE